MDEREDGLHWHTVHMLIAMAGLPGTGKSYLAGLLARRLDAVLLSVDLAESAMVKAGMWHNEATGQAAYFAIESMARQNLVLGRDVIVDAANHLDRQRRLWMDLADGTGTDMVFLLSVCSDSAEHRRRLGKPYRKMPGLVEPDWDGVQQRNAETEPWGTEPRLAIDTAHEVNLEQVQTLISCFGASQDAERVEISRPAARRASRSALSA